MYPLKPFSQSLIIRGLVLILFEFTIVSWSWSFNPLYPMLYAQVIWAIGWGFVILGLLRFLGIYAIFVAGLLLVFGHNLFDGTSFEPNTFAHTAWSIAHQKNVLDLPFDFQIRTTYPVAPIVGLMALAYCAGVYYKAQQYSKKVMNHALLLGVTCLALYGILRGFNLYGDMSQFAYTYKLITHCYVVSKPNKVSAFAAVYATYSRPWAYFFKGIKWFKNRFFA